MTAVLINAAAWIGAGIFAALLLADFVKTEREAKKEEKRHE